MQTINKNKIYIYPKAQKHAHDYVLDGIYKNCVPFSEDGIKKHFIVTQNQFEADLFYMGQFSDGNDPFNENNFPFLNGKENKHFADIEGDWFQMMVPEKLLECNLTINGAKLDYYNKKRNFFVRPTFSYLFLDLINKKVENKYEKNLSRIFSFKGQLDPYGTRMKVAQSLARTNLKYEIYFNEKSYSREFSGTKITQEYCDLIKNSTFSLCPMGVGYDTIRYFETCAFGRIPIVISNTKLFLEDELENFWFKINFQDDVDQIKNKLMQISLLSDKEIIKKQELAYNFFEKDVRQYFEDPTLFYINWAKNKGILN